MNRFAHTTACIVPASRRTALVCATAFTAMISTTTTTTTTTTTVERVPARD